MDKKKSGFVCLIGRPNVGKSTLMNHLIGQKIAITANKPQTTRNRIQTVYTDVRGQVVFLDSPGMHHAKNRLGEFMMKEAHSVVAEADVILWLVEPVNYIGTMETEIIEILKETSKPILLIMNKTDLTDKKTLEESLKLYEGLLDFKKVIPVSALRNQHVSKVMDEIFKYLPEGPQYYDEDTITDQPMRQIAAEIVREKAIRLLKDEVPHGIAVVIESMKERKNGMFDIEASVICERESHKGIIIGKGGQMLKAIGTKARIDIEKMMEARVNLKLYVKVRNNWRDSELFMKNFGYQEGAK